MDLLGLLKQYNRKERNYVASHFLLGGKNDVGNIILHKDFISNIEKVTGTTNLNKKNYFASFEYYFDWVYASLEELSGKLSVVNERPQNDLFFTGRNNTDIDLLIVTYDDKTDKYDFFFLEAKMSSPWEKKQNNSKLDRMLLILNNNYANIENVYFIFCSNDMDNNALAISNAKKHCESSNFTGFYSLYFSYTKQARNDYIGRFRTNTNIETSILIEYVINGNFNFNIASADIVKFIETEFSISLTDDIFIALDYKIDCVLKSLGAKSKGLGRLDTDLLLVNKKTDNKLDLFFVEAKVYTDWDYKQLNKKISEINLIEQRFQDHAFYFLTFQRSEKKPVIMCLHNRIGTGSITINTSGKFKTQRCDRGGTPSITGSFWKKVVVK